MSALWVWFLALAVCFVIGFLLRTPKMASFTVWYMGSVAHFLCTMDHSHMDGWWCYPLVAVVLLQPWLMIMGAYGGVAIANALCRLCGSRG